ncbi:MAG: RnfABCDGE type electron transport complex subunit D [Bacilli bacterium]|nr:RnfABCDGE type electron transport complex subunit D [Bacilli bacterium]
MSEFKTCNKTYVKSNNSIKRINLNYVYSLLFIVLYYLIYNYIRYSELIIGIKSIISVILCILLWWMMNSKKKILEIIIDDNILSISLILSLLFYKYSYNALGVAIVSTLGFKKIYKNIELSSVLIGLLVGYIYVFLFEYPIATLEIESGMDNIICLLRGDFYISSIVSLITFLYLFNKKSIKYNLFISYVLTITLIILMYSLFNSLGLEYFLITILSSNIIFYAVYILCDSKRSPIIAEGQILYGIVMGIISSVLLNINPFIGIIIVLMLGVFVISKGIDNFSINMRYNNRLRKIVMIVSCGLIPLTSILLTILK